MGERRSRPYRSRDDGQASILLVLVVVVGLVAMLLVTELGGVVLDRARARTAADAAALAGEDGGRGAAEALARENGGVVEAWSTRGGSTEVTVRVGHARATATARPGSG
jgi:uncharacterized membrane protein